MNQQKHRPPEQSGMRRYLVWGAIGLLLLVWLFLYCIEPLDGVLGDFRVYYLATVRFSEGLSIYNHVYEITAADGRLFRLFYFYPPFFAQWMQPFASLSFEVAQKLWVLLSALALLVAAGCCAYVLRALRGPSITVAGAMLAGLALVLCFEPTYWGIKEGQVNAILLALLSGALASTLARQQFLAGVCIGLAALIKMSPALLLVVPLVRGEWRVLVGSGSVALLAFLGLVLLAPFEVYREILTPFGPLLGGTLERHYIFNFAFDKAVLGVLGLDEQVPLRWLIRALLLGLAIGLAWSWRTLATPQGAVFQYVLLLPFMVLGAPTLWGHHFVWLLPAFCVLFARSADSSQDAARHAFYVLGLYVLIGQTMLIQLSACRAVLPDKCGIQADMVAAEPPVPVTELMLNLTTLLPSLLILAVAYVLTKMLRECSQQRFDLPNK